MIEEGPFKKVTKLREQGKHRQAYDLINKLLWQFAQQKDYKHLASAFGHRSYIWKHLAKLNEKPLYSHLAIQDAETQLLLVKKYKLEDQLHTALFIAGKLKLIPGMYDEASRQINEALNIYQGTDAEKADWKSHLGLALYKSEKKQEGLSLLKESIADLQQHKEQVPSYEFNVWLSGAYMRTAIALKDDNEKEAKEFLGEAKKIIQSDKRLIIRKKQFQQLQNEF